MRNQDKQHAPRARSPDDRGAPLPNIQLRPSTPPSRRDEGESRPESPYITTLSPTTLATVFKRDFASSSSSLVIRDAPALPLLERVEGDSVPTASIHIPVTTGWLDILARADPEPTSSSPPAIDPASSTDPSPAPSATGGTPEAPSTGSTGSGFGSLLDGNSSLTGNGSCSATNGSAASDCLSEVGDKVAETWNALPMGIAMTVIGVGAILVLALGRKFGWWH